MLMNASNNRALAYPQRSVSTRWAALNACVPEASCWISLELNASIPTNARMTEDANPDAK